MFFFYLLLLSYFFLQKMNLLSHVKAKENKVETLIAHA